MANAFSFDVRQDFKQVERMVVGIKRKVIPTAKVRALNKVIRPTQGAVVKHLSKDIGITQKEARKHLRIHRATKTNQVAAVSASGRRLSLIAMGARQVGKRKRLRNKKTGSFKGGKVVGRGGVKYRGKGGRKKMIPGAFIADMPGGGKGVFRRRGTGRLPIDKKFGPSIPYVFIKRASQKAMREAARKRLPKTYEQELNHELTKQGYR